jgi:hypothetical protein
MAKFSNNSYSKRQCEYVIESDIDCGTGDFSWISESPDLETALSLFESASTHWSNYLNTKKPQYRIVKASNSEIIKTTETK